MLGNYSCSDKSFKIAGSTNKKENTVSYVLNYILDLQQKPTSRLKANGNTAHSMNAVKYLANKSDGTENVISPAEVIVGILNRLHLIKRGIK